MKKILTLSLAFVVLLSCVFISGCTKNSNDVSSITAPGTYEITKKTIGRYLTFATNGYGEGVHYVRKVAAAGFEPFGYEDVGFTVCAYPTYTFEASFSNVELSGLVMYSYSEYVDSTTLVKTVSEEIPFSLKLDETGRGTFKFMGNVDLSNNVYCNYAFSPKVLSIEIEEASGSVTYAPRDTKYDFIRKPTDATATPAAKAE